MVEMPDESKQRAISLMEMTSHMFRPVEVGELEKYSLGLNGKPLWTPREDGGFGI